MVKYIIILILLVCIYFAAKAVLKSAKHGGCVGCGGGDCHCGGGVDCHCSSHKADKALPKCCQKEK